MFVIKQKSTGFYMPIFPGRAGGTYEEPTDRRPPRLFRRRQDAKSALSWWLEGKVRASYDFEGNFDGWNDVRKVPHRKAEDMEIVEVRLVEVRDEVSP